MARTEREIKPLEAIREVPDRLRRRIEPILTEGAPPPPRENGGRKRIDWRAAFNGVISRLRSGCQWNELPKGFGDDSSARRWFQRWCGNGVFEEVRAVPVEECDDLGAVDREWQGADGVLGKARFGGEKTGRDPTDRGEVGTKKSVLVEADGGPLGAVTAGADVPGCKPLDETIEAVAVERPDPREVEQNLCSGAGYDNPSGRAAVGEHKYVGHVRPVYEDRRPDRRPGRRKARRWVAERAPSWLSKCRGLPVRYDKHAEDFLGLIRLACGLLRCRRLHKLKAA